SLGRGGQPNLRSVFSGLGGQDFGPFRRSRGSAGSSVAAAGVAHEPDDGFLGEGAAEGALGPAGLPRGPTDGDWGPDVLGPVGVGPVGADEQHVAVVMDGVHRILLGCACVNHEVLRVRRERRCSEATTQQPTTAAGPWQTNFWSFFGGRKEVSGEGAG